MKTHQAAVVVVPPDEVCVPIQEIRRQFDKKVDRWMPHVNLLYPFRPRSEFEAAGDRLAEVLAAHEPCELTLAEFRYFELRPEHFSIWLDPEPRERLIGIQAAMQAAFTDCHDVSNFPGGFSPHLSVGQAHGRGQLRERLEAMRSGWAPLRFRLEELALISREEESPFEVVRKVALGGSR